MTSPSSPIGFLVKHPVFGLARVVSVDPPRRVTAEILTSKEILTFIEGSFTRAILGPGTTCKTERGLGVIRNGMATPGEAGPMVYKVESPDGLTQEVPETELTPIARAAATSPLEALVCLDHDPYSVFEKREGLVEAWLQTFRDGRGARALLSSRIDLRPHQAYVAGTVLLDHQQRYLLADEVGLGKTIEAGIVIHDLLWRVPDANILVLCPGTLTQQWLCELYSKFSGRVFQLPELRGAVLAGDAMGKRVILSFTSAMNLGQDVTGRKWDLVVVDEAHHLLALPQCYRLAQELSLGTTRLLLLSALPAQHREEEYLRLLALLEPSRYDPGRPGAPEQFAQLYNRQVDLGRKLGYVSRRLNELESPHDSESTAKILAKVQEMASMPVLSDDLRLGEMAKGLAAANGDFVGETKRILRYLGENYRINRRILRNRRSRLIQAQQMKVVERRLNHLSYDASQFELDAQTAVRALLKSLRGAGLSEEVLLPLARQLFQALSSPTSLCQVLLMAAPREDSGAYGDETRSLDSLVGYADWETQIRGLWRAAEPLLSNEIMHQAVRAAKAWLAAPRAWHRFNELLEFLRKRHRRDPQDKFLIFAGAPGLAKHLAEALSKKLHEEGVARFHFRMLPDPAEEQQEKEAEVARFRKDPKCWLLITDETAGEGRNFQFATGLIHFDLPWHVAQIEQRIGRLDRLGRELAHVTSTVLFGIGSEEEAFIECLSVGFEVFSRSISGLEFALRECEQRMTRTAIVEGVEGLRPLAPSLREASETERAQDESQDLLDEASNDRVAAEAFRRVQSAPESDKKLEKAFFRFLRGLSDNKAAWFETDPQGTDGIIRFRPENLNGFDLRLPKDANGRLRDRRGTFRRKLAQERPDLEFFSVGNDFCDAILDSLMRSPRGRSYAVECLGSHPVWRGFEFCFRASGSREALVGHPGLYNQLDRVFAVRTERCFVAEDHSIAREAEALEALRRSLTKENEGHTWRNLAEEGAGQLARFYADWMGLVRKCHDVAQNWIRIRFQETLAPILTAECARIAEQQRYVEHQKADGWEAEVDGLKMLARSILEWELELETVGFISVNGGIAE